MRRRVASAAESSWVPRWLKFRHDRGLTKRFVLFCLSCGLLLGSATPPVEPASAHAAHAAFACSAPAAGRCSGPGERQTPLPVVDPPAAAEATPPAPVVVPALPPAAPVVATAREAAPRAYIRDDRWDFAPDGTVRVVVSLPLQSAYVFRGHELVATSPVSTGRRSHPTPTGRFPILQKRVHHRSNLYDNAPMPYMQRLTHGGIALHAGHLPGYPASHGCIRFPYDFARWLYRLTDYSSEVIITRRRPSSSHEAANLI